jgi:hypothetical protein
VVQAATAPVLAHLGREQAGLAGPGLQFAAQVIAGAVVFDARIVLVGNHHLADEALGARLQFEFARAAVEFDHGLNLV